MSLRERIPGGITSLLNFFGVTADGNRDLTFMLNGEVVPVAIVGSLATFTSQSTPMELDVPFSAGLTVNPLANAVIADTLARSVGSYNVTVQVGCNSPGVGTSQYILLQRRDAANATSVWQMQIPLDSQTSPASADCFKNIYVKLLEGERLRVLAGNNFNCTVLANIWANKMA